MAYGRKRISRKRVSRRSRTTPFKKAPVKRLVRNYKTKQLVKLIKGVQLKQAETCYKSVSRPISNLFHDTLRAIPIWSNSDTSIFPVQGSTDGERRGDEILVTGIKMRMAFQIPYDRRNTTFRMWYVPMNSSQGDPTNYSNFFHNVSGNSMLDPVQTDHWKGIKFLGVFKPRAVDQFQADVGNNKTVFVQRWLPMKKKVCFINDGSTVPSNLREEAFIVIAPYDAYATYTTDIVITQVESTFTLYYKDP